MHWRWVIWVKIADNWEFLGDFPLFGNTSVWISTLARLAEVDFQSILVWI